MLVLEPGPGMGFFMLELAKLVGPRGRVIAVDVQPKMIAGLRRRAARAGLSGRIEARVVPAETMALAGCDGAFDFVLAFAVVHELPSAEQQAGREADRRRVAVDRLVKDFKAHPHILRGAFGEDPRRSAARPFMTDVE